MGAQVGPEEYDGTLARAGGDLCRCGRRPVAIIAHHGSGHGNYLGRHCSVCFETSYRRDAEYVWAGGEWVSLAGLYDSDRLDTNLTYLLWTTMRGEMPERTPSWEIARAQWDSIRSEPNECSHETTIRLMARNLDSRAIWALCVLNPGLSKHDAQRYLARSPERGTYFLDVVDECLPPQWESAPSVALLRTEVAAFESALSLVPHPTSNADLLQGGGSRFTSFITRQGYLELSAVTAADVPVGWGRGRDAWHVAFDGAITPQGDVDPAAARALADWSQQHDIVAVAIRRHCEPTIFSAQRALEDDTSLGELEASGLLRKVRIGRALLAAADLPPRVRQERLTYALACELASDRLADVRRGQASPPEALSVVPTPQDIRRMAVEGAAPLSRSGTTASWRRRARRAPVGGREELGAVPTGTTVLPSWPHARRLPAWFSAGWRDRRSHPR